MLTICLGPNGSGKSLWCMYQLIWFLMHDTRVIITSLAVKMGRLNDYLQKRYGDRAPDVMRRVVLIDKEDQKTFWRVRGKAFDGEYGEVLVRRGPFGDASWQEQDGGRIYILDEVQTTFGARDWQKTGGEFCAYQSQHRHFGDDVVAVSPASALLDKQFRILAGECVALNNLYKLKVGWIKAPRYIKYAVYSNCPPIPAETPLTTGKIHIEPKALCACYDTSAGLGHIGGGQADKGKEAKGIPFYWLFPALAAAALLVWLGFRSLLHMGVDRGIKKLSISASVGVPPVEVVSGVVPKAQVGALAGPVVERAAVKKMNDKDKIWIIGWTMYPSPRVMMSDGQTYRVPVRVSGGIAHVEIDGVEYDSIPTMRKRGEYD